MHLFMVQHAASSAEWHMRMCRLWTMELSQAKNPVHYAADLLLEEGPSCSLSQDEPATIQDEP